MEIGAALDCRWLWESGVAIDYNRGYALYSRGALRRPSQDRLAWAGRGHTHTHTHIPPLVIPLKRRVREKAGGVNVKIIHHW